jgi:hypothetical protein
MKRTTFTVLLTLLLAALPLLSVFSIDFPGTLSSEDDSSEHWYYIYNPMRSHVQGGHVFTDVSGALNQTILKGTPGDDQLWKVVKQADDQYVFINKATGNKIDCSEGTITLNNTTTGTFKLLAGTGANTGYWIIATNKALTATQFNKSNNSAGYSLYNSTTDAGNAVAFIPQGQESKILKNPYPQLSVDSDEHWYYIMNPFRMRNTTGGHVMADVSGALKQTKVTETLDETQLWKIVDSGNDSYTFVNKATGNKFDIPGSGSSFTLSATATSTFKLLASAGSNGLTEGYGWASGYWTIYNVERGIGINKSNTDDTYSLYGSGTTATSDVGNIVSFIPQGQEAEIINTYPQFSTDDDEHWYRIHFQRRSINKAIEEGSSNLKQLAVEDKTAQYFKFAGTPDNFTIETYSGNEWAANGDRYISKEKGEGNSFKFEPSSLAELRRYQIGDNVTGSYINDYQGTEVTNYSANDAGSWFYYTPVSPASEFTVAGETLDFEVAPVNQVKGLPFVVATRNLSGTVSYAISGTDAPSFVVDAEATVWSQKRGGTLVINFTPTTVKAYIATLEITANGETKQVALTGSGSSDPILTVTPETLPFGATTVDLASDPKTVTVSIAYATDDITYTVTGDATAFSIDATQFVPATGGTLSVTFEPTEVKDYEAAIVVSSVGATTKTIALTGTGEVTELPVTLSTVGNEAWYYITFDKRSGSGNAVQAMGEDKMLEARPAIEAEDAQLWKVVSTDVSGKYQIISKSGKQLAYTATAEGDVLADRFYTAETTTYTYSFTKLTDGAWQIRCNEENSYINKANLGSSLNNPYFGKYGVLGDVGSSVVFVPEADMAYPLPQFSTATENHWYRVQYVRRSPLSVTTTGQNKVITDNGADANMTQTDLAEGNLSQYWKFVGTWDSFKLVSFNGLEMQYNTTAAKYQTVAAGNGGNYKLAWSNNVYDTWRISDPSIPTIVNDQGGATLTRYGENAGDGGNALQFLPAEPVDFVINAGETKSAADYRTDVYSDVVFKSTDASTGQLTGIETGGLEVNGVVKLVKTLTPAAEYALGFPFAIDEVSSSDYTLQSYNGTTNEYEPATTLEPAKAYLLTFTGAAEEEITFTSTENPVLKNTTTPAPALASGYTLLANPSVANVAAIDGATRYYAYGTEGFTLLESTATLTLKPFEAVIAVKDVTTLYPEIGNGLPDGLSAIDAKDPVILVKYYNLQGVEVRQPVEGNIYLVRKLHASQRIEVVKELQIKK